MKKQLREEWRSCTRDNVEADESWRVEMKQLTEVWRSCTRYNAKADESYFVLNPLAEFRAF